MFAVLSVFVGGGLGSLCRYALGLRFQPTAVAAFPWATFWANLLACLCLGLILGYLDRLEAGAQQQSLRWLLATGFCGGFSTFSTYSQECLNLLKLGHWPLALTYMFSSLVLGIALLALGYFLMK